MTDQPDLKPEDRALIDRVAEIIMRDPSSMRALSRAEEIITIVRQEGRCSPGEGAKLNGPGCPSCGGYGAVQVGSPEAWTWEPCDKCGGEPAPVSSPPPSGEVREAVARIIDPLVFELSDALDNAEGEPEQLRKDATAARDERLSVALAKADAILALIPGRDEAALPEAVIWVSPGQLAAHTDHDPAESLGGRYLPARKTKHGEFTQPLYAAPQAPAAAELPGDVARLVKASAQARDQFYSYVESHRAKGTHEGNEKANTNLTYGDMLDLTLAPFADRVPLDNEGGG